MSFKEPNPGNTRQNASTARSKKERQESLIAKCQSEFRERLQKGEGDTFWIPPDVGSQLYDWYRLHSDGIQSGQGDGEDECTSTLSFVDTKPREEAAIGGGISKVTSQQKPKRPLSALFVTNTLHQRTKRPKTSTAVSSDLSDRETVFTPPGQMPESVTSHEEDTTSKTAGTSSQELPFYCQDKRSVLPRKRMARPSFSPLPSSPSDDPYTDASAHWTKTRPTTIPNTWEEAHHADKMIVAMRQEDRDWTTIAHRWTTMTGSVDKIYHLQWRYEAMKVRLKLHTDDDIERVPISEATSRSKNIFPNYETSMACSSQTSYFKTPQRSPDSSNDGAVEMSFEPVESATTLFINDAKQKTYAEDISSNIGAGRLNGVHAINKPRGRYGIGGRSWAHGTKSKWVTLALPSKKEPIRNIISATLSDKAFSDDTANFLAGDLAPEPSVTREHLPFLTIPPRATEASGPLRNTAKALQPKHVPRTETRGAVPRAQGINIKEYDRQRRHSEKLRETWAKRQAECRNGKYGGVPKASTIILAQKESARKKKAARQNHQSYSF